MSLSFFLDDNTALTLPAIPERDWTGQGGGEGRRSEVNAQLLLSSSGAWSEQGCGPHWNWSLPQAGKARVKPTASHPPPSPNSPQTLPPITCLQDPLPSWRAVWSHVESNGSFSLLMTVKNTLHHHISMQQPPVCSTSALYSWLTTHWSSPSSLCLLFSLIRHPWWRYF